MTIVDVLPVVQPSEVVTSFTTGLTPGTAALKAGDDRADDTTKFGLHRSDLSFLGV
jgi:hypothetical protein